MTRCNNANSSRYSQCQTLRLQIFPTSNHPVCRLLYVDDGAVTEKIVNLSVIIVMSCYMVEMTPRCIMGRWTLYNTSNISCSGDIAAAQKRKRFYPESQSMSTTPGLTIRCNYQIWHPSPPCTVLPLHAITPPVLYIVHIWTINHVLCGSWRAN